jgi:hypothetical protein
MRETRSEDVPQEQEVVSEAGVVIYRIKVLSTSAGPSGKPVRTVLFQRTSPGEHLVISAEIDGPNLLAGLPDLLEAALDVQRRGLSRVHAPHAEEARRVRRLALGEAGQVGEAGEGDAPRRGGPLRLVGLPVDAPGPVM